MQTLLNGRDGLRGVDGGRAGNHHGLQAGLALQHVIIVEICPDVAELGLGGVELCLDGRGHGDELGLGRQVGKMASMTDA